ncbi:ABC transporter substrate-binding protein [Paenibacillus popilliae]|uniref:Periplasmic component n=1 Tax=Paenibacillus popilliae ATCC 14706 TaxID=1212764 RepID=M9LK36_PAEPP|nr:extracellular solute-binding protein [Paenibacillus popilliae]GAC43640.1 periplasmic component [Paenibacillus popilliae ATCC 14706]
MRKVLMTIALLSLVIVYGCSPAHHKDKKEDYSDQEITIYAFESHEQFFYSMYGNLILQQFPGLNLRVLTSKDFAWDKDGEHNQKSPDLVIIGIDEYRKMADNSYLLDLNPLIKRDHFDTERYQPEMIRALTDQPAGKLYGLSPNVYIDGIFYNKELFDDMHIDYPKDGMDWYEMLALASRFDGGIVGFESTISSPGALLMQMVETNKWNFIDEKRKVTSWNKEQWLKAVQAVVTANQTNSVAEGAGDLFFKGKSALYAAPVNSVEKLRTEHPFSWGFVSSPVGVNDKSISRSIIFYRVLSIPEGSSQKELAWEIIQMLMGEEAVIQYKDNERFNTVSTFKKYANNYKGVDLTNIWRQSIDGHPGTFPEWLSTEFYGDLYEMLDTSLQKAIKRDMTVEECANLIIENVTELVKREKVKNRS